MKISMTEKLRKGIIFLDNNRGRRPINKNFDLDIHYERNIQFIILYVYRISLNISSYLNEIFLLETFFLPELQFSRQRTCFKKRTTMKCISSRWKFSESNQIRSYRPMCLVESTGNNSVAYTRGNSLGKLFTSSYRNRLHGKSISRASGSWTTRNERLNPLTFSCSPAFEIGTHHQLSIVLTSCLLRYNCVTTLIKVTSYEIRVRQTLSFAFIQLEILGKNAVRHSFGKLHRKTNLLIGCFVEFFNSNVFYQQCVWSVTSGRYKEEVVLYGKIN